MRSIVLLVLFVVGLVDVAAAQTGSRMSIGPVARLDRVFVEGGARGATAVAGALATIRLGERYGVEVELTRASNPIERSYEGTFISYGPVPSPSREEFDRFAPKARRTLGYRPGMGWSAAVVARRGLTPRTTLGARAGISSRAYSETSNYEILSVPEGVDPARIARDFQDTVDHVWRGGLLVGADLTLALTEHLSVAPELRLVYGGPARIGNTHREAGVGARGTWRF